MRAVVTRPAEDAERIAAPLRARGVDVLIEPLLTITPKSDATLDLDGVQALLLTSANGVRALAAVGAGHPDMLLLPALAVGDQTAAVAREAGFGDVAAAEGDVTSLAALVRARLKPEGGALLHAAGSVVAGDLAGDLGRDGYEVRRAVLYAARPADAFSTAFRDTLAAGTVNAVFLYSPRTAKTFATLAHQADLRDACRGLRAYCLSQAVADAVADVPFAAVRVAERPEQDALLAVFDKDNGDHVCPPTPAAQAAESKGESSMSDRPEEQRPEKDAAKDTGKAPATGAATDSAASAAADSADATSESPPEPTPDSGKKGSGRGVGMVIGVIAALILLALVSLPWWAGLLPNHMRGWADHMIPGTGPGAAAVTEEVADLRGTLQTLDRRVAEVEQQVADMAAAPAPAVTAEGGVDEQALGQALRTLDQRIAALENRPEPQAVPDLTDDVAAVAQRLQELEDSRIPPAAVMALGERMERLESRLRDAGTRQEEALAFMTAVVHLREAVMAGRPFDSELRATRATAPQDVDVAASAQGFADRAGQGVATRPALRQRLDVQGQAIIRASAAPQDGDTWWNRTIDRALTVVSVRRTDGLAVGDGTAAVVSRAEALMDGGDLGGAVAELESLQGAPAEAAADWLTDARARLTAEAALSDLSAEAVARLTAARQQAAAGQEG